MPETTQRAPVHDFGGDGPVLHLAHANGFPPGAYRLLAETLTPDYRVLGLPARPLWSGSQPQSAPTWHPLTNDLIEGLDALGLSGIIGIGHSLGGVLTLWAAILHPDLFRAVILIDPVILPPIWLWALRLVRGLGLAQRQPLVQGALRRRHAWPNRQDCFEQYRARSFFARLSDEALWDYVKFGTEQRDDSLVALRYPPAWEAQIFATTPTGIWRDVPRLRIPTLVVRGEHSQTFQPAAEKRMARRLPQARFVTIRDAGHLLPLERPAETGAVLREFVDAQHTGMSQV
jgi:pimeloyl-ACP methyl ester carboxylesterase